MKYLLGTIILILNLSTYAQTGIEEEDWSRVKSQNFDSLLTDLTVDFSIPEYFSETELIENDNVPYNKGYKFDSSGFEIRIWVRDLRNTKAPEGLSADQFSKSFFTMVSLNASGYVLPNTPKITVFDSGISNTEFNADWVASTAFLPISNGFNTGFEVCSIIGMRKNNIAEIYVFYMISDRASEVFLVKELAQVVTFK